jgi:PilZ domain
VGGSPVQVAPLRRTQRVQIAMPVVVRGTDFQESTSTAAVNVDGCMVKLRTSVARGDLIWVINSRTGEELPGKVVSIGKPEDGKLAVGIEFSEGSPHFWRINFPPGNWLSSAERKRPDSKPQVK